jgi:hypothetical protein
MGFMNFMINSLFMQVAKQHHQNKPEENTKETPPHESQSPNEGKKREQQKVFFAFMMFSFSLTVFLQEKPPSVSNTSSDSDESKEFRQIIDVVNQDYLIGYMELPWSCWDHSQRSNYVRELEESRKAKQMKDIGHCYFRNLSVFTAVIKGEQR